MGQIIIEKTHKPRSSSMSLASRWKHENIRAIIVMTTIIVMIMLIAVLTWHHVSKKTLAVLVNGKETLIETRLSTLHNVLNEHTLTLGKHDFISKPLHAKVANGDRIVIERAFPIQVMIDGKKKVLYTIKKPVNDVLAMLQVPINPKDKIYPSKSTFVTKGINIQIVRVSKKIEEKKIKIPFQVLKQANIAMFKGETKTIQSGKEGLAVQKIQKTYEDGKLIYSQFIHKSIHIKPIDKVIAYGTKKRPGVAILSAKNNSISNSGKNIRFKKILKNFQLTAYTETKGSPGAKTALGTTVSEGRTIAVDPKVIPLGWWVYIKGLGLRLAEDVGSAVKGLIIDVYFNSKKKVGKFGCKKGYTVYVVGPVKPRMK